MSDSSRHPYSRLINSYSGQSNIIPLIPPPKTGGKKKEGFRPESTGAPNLSNGIKVPSRKFIDVHETMKGVLTKQEGRDDITYDTTKFPTYAPRLNMTGLNAVDTSADNNTISSTDGTGLNLDGAVILSPGLAGAANGTDGGDTSTRPDSFPGAADSRPIGVSDYYFYFDSFYKEAASNPSLGTYVFDVRRINGTEPVKNVIELELLPFYLPKVETNPLFQPEYYFFRTVLMDIQSISSRQITKSPNQSQNFHFELEIEDAGSAVKATPKNPLFILTEPLFEITLLSVQFKIPPFSVASYPNDVFAVTAVFPSVLPPPGDRRMVTISPHGLTIGQNYAVYFTGYNSLSSTLNNIINNPIGQIITVIDNVTIQLTNTPGANAIGTTSTATGTAPTATMYVGPLRVAFNMRMRTIKRTETNFITPV